MNTVILFSKIPQLGYSKKRLLGMLNEEEALAIATMLLSNTSLRLHESKVPVVNYLAGDLEKITPAMHISGPIKRQEGQDLGERMKHALFQELDQADAVILVGSDLLGVDRALIEEAFQLLLDHDVVLAPTNDGGYGLVGLSKKADIFSGVVYSTSQVLEDTLVKAKEESLKVALTKTLEDVDEPEDLIAQHLGSRDFELLGAGEYHLNYRFKNYVLRINLGSQLNLGKDQILYEYQSLKALAPSGVVPRVYEAYQSTAFLPKGSLTMDFLPGRPLNYHKDLKVAAQILAAVHNTPITGDHWLIAKAPFQTMMDEFLTMFAFYEDWSAKDPAVEAKIQKFLAIAKSLGLKDELGNPCIINTELNNRNFLINETGPSYLIDWEKPIIGEGEQDLAHFLVPTTTYWKTDVILKAQDREAFLSEYEKLRPLDRAKLSKYLIFNICRGLTWSAMAQREYSQGRALSHGDTKAKIDEFLSSDFLDFIDREYFHPLSDTSLNKENIHEKN